MNRFLLFIAGFLLTLPGVAQQNQLQLIRISEDNDGLNTRRGISDGEYTNGTRVDVFYTKRTKPRLLTALLIPLRSQSAQESRVDNLYGVGLTQLMYTPSDLKKIEIVYNSRPYTAVLYVSHSLTSSDPIHHQRLTTEIDLGVLGKAALGKETQQWVHSLLDFARPKGWSHQLPTDVVVNYLIQYEKLIIQPSPYGQILGLLSSNLGTLGNNLNAGFLVRVGLFSSYFSNYERPATRNQIGQPPTYRKIQSFCFVRPVGRLVMSDATLQGGLFTHTHAQHVISRNKLERAVLQVEYGAAVSYNRLSLSFSERLITPQYQGAPSQQVGNISLLVGI